jgi:hypothetical protein
VAAERLLSAGVATIEVRALLLDTPPDTSPKGRRHRTKRSKDPNSNAEATHRRTEKGWLVRACTAPSGQHPFGIPILAEAGHRWNIIHIRGDVVGGYRTRQCLFLTIDGDGLVIAETVDKDSDYSHHNVSGVLSLNLPSVKGDPQNQSPLVGKQTTELTKAEMLGLAGGASVAGGEDQLVHWEIGIRHLINEHNTSNSR